MPLFALTIFLSAFLLFQVELILAKFILPWYGGAPAVWTTAMLFFQVVLVAGYAYAHVIGRIRSPRVQALVHTALLALSLLFLPIVPGESLRPSGHEQPIAAILWLLFKTVGLPFLLVASTSSLLQYWVSRSQGRSPYRLYALSNLGSLLALLSYPVLIEPRLALSTQMVTWSFGYGAFALLCVWCAVVQGRAQALPEAVRAEPEPEPEPPPVQEPRKTKTKGKKRAKAVVRPRVAAARKGTSRSDVALWTALPACASIMFLAVTNKMCQDVAVVPLLWVLPLSLYLLTFIIAFDRAGWYDRRVWIPLLVVSVAALVVLLFRDYVGTEVPLRMQILIYSAGLFCCCMVLHGEMVRLKPPPARLTLFYLMVSVGGALGGVFVNLVAPLIFTGYWELHLSIVATVVLVGIRLAAPRRGETRVAPRAVVVPVTVVAVIALAWLLGRQIAIPLGDVLDTKRGFFGVLRVREAEAGTTREHRFLQHGRIRHGLQFTYPALRSLPTLFYDETSGVGAAMHYRPHRTAAGEGGLKTGVIGMGIGTIAAYSRPGDSLVFYEINPQVDDLARRYFTFLSDAGRRADVRVVLGDGRVSLERDLAESGPEGFDVLVLDAFSGDAIPVHLLTDEAFTLYWQHLRPDGILAIHISSLHTDLSDVVRTLAARHGKTAVRIETSSDERLGRASSRWVLVTSNQEFLHSAEVRARIGKWNREPRRILWTDDYSNLLQVLR